MPNWYVNGSRFIDPLVGLSLGGLIFLSKWCPWLESVVRSVFDEKRAALYGAVASIAGSLLGFAIAAITIVLTVVQMPKLRMVRDSKYYSSLWSTFQSAIWWLFAATICGFLGIALDSEVAPHLWVSATASGVALVAGLRVLNAIWILEQIVIIATGPART